MGALMLLVWPTRSDAQRDDALAAAAPWSSNAAGYM
jgi:hypothetical protein